MVSCGIKISDELRFVLAFLLIWELNEIMRVKHVGYAWHMVNTTEKVLLAVTSTITTTWGLDNKQQMQDLTNGTQWTLMFPGPHSEGLWESDKWQGYALWPEPQKNTVHKAALFSCCTWAKLLQLCSTTVSSEMNAQVCDKGKRISGWLKIFPVYFWISDFSF